MKATLITAAVLAVLAVIILGGEKTYSYVAASRQAATKKFEQSTPMNLEFSRLDTLLASETRRVLDFQDRLVDLELRAKAAEKSATQLKGKIEAEVRLLEKIGGMLDEKRDQYDISGKTYTYAQVNDDANQRLKNVAIWRDSFKAQQEAAVELRQAITTGRKNVEDAKRKIEELGSEKAGYEARNVNADLRQEVASMMQSLDTTLLTPNTELASAFQNVERRISRKENQAESNLSGTSLPMISYDTTLSGPDASAQIQQLLRDVADEGSKQKNPETQPAITAGTD